MARNTTGGPDFPKARSEKLLVEELAGELLIYDERKNRAHCLNGTAAAIWQHCDGNRSLAMLAEHLFPKLDGPDGQRLVGIGVERLRRRGLVESSAAALVVDLSKRQMLKKMAIMAAAAGIVAPLVSSVVAPKAAYAFSCMPSGAPCSADVQCCSAFCRSLQCI